MMTLHSLATLTGVPLHTLSHDPKLRVVRPGGVPCVSAAAVEAWLDAQPRAEPATLWKWTRAHAEGLAKAQGVRHEQTERARAIASDVVLALLPTDPDEPPRNARWLGAELSRRVGAGRRVRDAVLTDLATRGLIVRVVGGWKRAAAPVEG